MSMPLTGAGPPPGGLRRNLTDYWSLDEATDTRADAVRALGNLTMHGTVAGAAGKNGNAAVFDANLANYLIATSAVPGQASGSFTLNTWVKPSVDTNHVPVNKGYSTLQFEWRLRVAGGAGVQFFVSNDGTASDSVSTGGITVGAYNMVTAWHDAVAKTINVGVNAGAPATLAHTTGVFNGTALIQFGTQPAGLGETFSGQVDETGFWTRVLTAAERTKLYNGGSGKFYPTGF